jgi:hypothetical protein
MALVKIDIIDPQAFEEASICLVICARDNPWSLALMGKWTFVARM